MRLWNRNYGGNGDVLCPEQWIFLSPCCLSNSFIDSTHFLRDFFGDIICVEQGVYVLKGIDSDGTRVGRICIFCHKGIYRFELIALIRKVVCLYGAAFKISPESAAGEIIGSDSTPCFFGVCQQIYFTMVGS